MKKLPTQTDTDPMEQAYKLLGGDPAGDAVSVAAKGGKPESDDEQRFRTQAPKDQVADEDDELECGPDDVQRAYAQLFESLATILRH